MKKEILIYMTIFIVLSFVMHFNEWISTPFIHMTNLGNSGAYGLGILHPFIFVLLIYIILLIPRIILKLFKK